MLNGSPLGPGPRGMLLKNLAAPRTKKELAHRTGLPPAMVDYYLKTLEERCCIVKLPRAGRELKYIKRDFTPPAPKPENLIVVRTDPNDWRTWMFRLLCAKLGGPAVVPIATPTSTATPSARRRLLLIGTKPPWRQQLRDKFPDFELVFFDNPKTSRSGMMSLMGLIARCERVIFNTGLGRHGVFYFLREQEKKRAANISYIGKSSSIGAFIRTIEGIR